MIEQLQDNEISQILDPSELINLPILDISAFQDLRETIGDDGVFSDLVTIYFNSAETLIDTIQLALANQDTDKFTLATHSLKSTSASIGAAKLAKICKQLEKAGKIRQVSIFDSSEIIVVLLNNEYTQAIAAIKNLVIELITNQE